MNLSAKLKSARSNIGLTQRQVSQRSGIDDSSLSAFEIGNTEPRLGQLAKLAEVYRVPVSYFFEETEPVNQAVLWRNEPEKETEIQAEFLELCRQYWQLEVWTNEVTEKKLPDVDNYAKKFHYPQVVDMAIDVRNLMGLGDRPGQSLHTTLEEVYGVKIFCLDLDESGSAACAMSDEFGPAILLNKRCSRWRRNHDLAHELFHLLTWKRFDHTDSSVKPTEQEEKFATCFAGNLLLPNDAVKSAINKATDDKGSLSFEQLDKIAREFDVSVESLLWRMHFLFRWKPETTTEHISKADAYVRSAPREKGPEPQLLPERFRALAIKALRSGEIAQGRFAKFMRISRSKASHFLVEEESDYGEVPISAA